PVQEQNKQAENSEPAKLKEDRFGDPLPDGAIARLGTLRFRHGDAIASIASSPDGKLQPERTSPWATAANRCVFPKPTLPNASTSSCSWTNAPSSSSRACWDPSSQ